MRDFIQFCFESSIILAAFILLYHLFLRKETSFSFIRILMVSGAILSMVLPALNIEVTAASPLPAINHDILTIWLPEVIIGRVEAAPHESSGAFGIAGMLTNLYWAGVVIFAGLFIYQIIRLLSIIRKPARRHERYRIIDVDQEGVTFSFFNFIVVGKLNALSHEEREQIMRHEKAHADRLHSFDIILIDLLKVLFWFNPLIRVYKNILVQLHEFEADARSVGRSDVDHYCSLMAKVALESSGIKVASCFHQSLTLKRIQMIRTIKHNISRWKVALTFIVASAVGIMVACEDQSKPDAKTDKDVPQEAISRFEAFRISHAGATFLVENDSKKDAAMKTLEADYGQPVSSETFTVTVDGKDRVFELLEFKSQIDPDQVFSVVDEMPEYKGGFEKLVEFMQDNMKMPSTLTNNGTTYVSFIVEKDGALSDVQVMRPFDPEADAEALRVVNSFPKWKPGRTKGETVRTKMVLPVSFKR